MTFFCSRTSMLVVKQHTQLHILAKWSEGVPNTSHTWTMEWHSHTAAQTYGFSLNVSLMLVWRRCTSSASCWGCKYVFGSIWDLSFLETWIRNLLTDFVLCFKPSPHLLQMKENAATLFCCKALKGFVDYDFLPAWGGGDNDLNFICGWTVPLMDKY